VANVFMLRSANYLQFDSDDLTDSSGGVSTNYPSGSPSIQGGAYPISDGDYLYAQSTGTDVAWKFEYATRTYSRLTTTDRPAMCADDGLGNIWVACDANASGAARVERIDKSSWTITRTVNIQNNGVCLWVDPYLWVHSRSTTGQFSIYDPVTDTVVDTFTYEAGTSGPAHAALHDGFVYAASNVGTLYKINATTGVVADTLSIASVTRLLGLGDYIYTLSSETVGGISYSRLRKIDVASLSIDSTLEVSGTTSGLGLTSNGLDVLYATLTQNNTLRRIDAESLTVTHTAASLGSIGQLVYDVPYVPPTPGAAGWVVGSVGW